LERAEPSLKYHRIEHAEMITEEQIEKVKELSVLLCMQPNFNCYYRDIYFKAPGEEQACRINPIDTVDKKGWELLRFKITMRKFIVSEEGIPKKWFNILPLLPEPLEPPLDPETKEPISPDKLLAIFPEPLIEREVSEKEWIDIPEEVKVILFNLSGHGYFDLSAYDKYLHGELEDV